MCVVCYAVVVERKSALTRLVCVSIYIPSRTVLANAGASGETCPGYSRCEANLGCSCLPACLRGVAVAAFSILLALLSFFLPRSTLYTHFVVLLILLPIRLSIIAAWAGGSGGKATHRASTSLCTSASRQTRISLIRPLARLCTKGRAGGYYTSLTRGCFRPRRLKRFRINPTSLCPSKEEQSTKQATAREDPCLWLVVRAMSYEYEEAIRVHDRVM